MAGKRFKKEERKLNLKKVAIVILIIILLFILKPTYNFLKQKISKYTSNRIMPLEYRVALIKNKYGVIDTKGNIIINPEYDKIIIPNKTKDVFIANKDNKTIALNKNGNRILKKYDEIIPIEYTKGYDQNLLKVTSSIPDYKKDKDKNAKKVNQKNKYYLVDYSGDKKLNNKLEDIIPLKGITNSLKIKEDGKEGLINTRTIAYTVSPIYESVEPIVNNNDTAYIVKNEGFYGVIGNNGKKILETNFKEIVKTRSTTYVVAKKDSSESTIYDIKGKSYGEFSGQILDVKDGVVIRKKGAKVGACDLKGKTIIPYEYEDVFKISSKLFILKKDGKENIKEYDANEKKLSENLLKKDYDKIYLIDSTSILVASLNNKDEVYNSKFEKVIEGVIVEINNEELIINVGGTEKIYNFSLKEKKNSKQEQTNLVIFKENNKYGLKDIKGVVVVSPIYDEIIKQNKFGYSAIKRDNKWGCVDVDGNIVVEPSLNLDEYKVIDFISKYHLVKDADSLIYTDK